MTFIDVEQIPALDELKRLGVEFVPVSDNEVRCPCPVHDDASPSLCLNIEKNQFICQASSCKAKGDIVTLIGYYTKSPRNRVVADLLKRYDIETVKSLKPSLAEDDHQNLGSAPAELLKALIVRGITQELMDKHKLGYRDGRITIPIFDSKGNLRNIKKYLPGVKEANRKMVNTRGYGNPPILYLGEQIESFDKIIICGGELKAIVAAHHMNPFGYGAVSSTHGEGHWDIEWSSLVKNKEVWICMDIDPAGQSAAIQMARILAEVTTVRIVKLDLDKSDYPKGDLNDYFGSAKKEAEDFLKVLDSSEIFQTIEDKIENSDPVEIQLRDAPSTRNIGRKITFEATVAALADSPYFIPKKVSVDCTRDKPYCAACPIFHMDPDRDTGAVVAEIPTVSPALVEMVNSPRSKQRIALMHALHIPHVCRIVSFKALTHFKVSDMKLAPRFDVRREDRDKTDNILIGAYLVSSRAPFPNASYKYTGTVHPHPNTQEAILILNKSDQLEDSLSSYSADDTELARLIDTFQPKDWSIESINEKIDDIYNDLEDNVTRIYGRRDMHIMFDLTYHSALMLPWDDQSIPGWVNSVIIGDSSQGKSETVLRLSQHYGVGERLDCKNSSKAGLIGGLEQISSRWYVRWGALPANDKGLVVLEESKGLSTDDFAGLTDCRSSGIAEISKIKSRKTYARTRLIAISNPRSGRAVNTYSFGVETIAELIGAMEDVRRFDIGLVIAEGEISTDTITKGLTKLETAKHKYTSDLCSSLILYGWTRVKDNFKLEEGFKDALLDATKHLTTRYTERFPLVDKGTTRYKLLRLSAALAIRLASFDKNHNVILRKVFIQWISDYLDKIYSSPVMGYLEYTRARDRANTIANPDLVRTRLLSERYAEDIVRNMLYTERIRNTDIMDWLDCEKDTAQTFISFFVRKRAIRRNGQEYIKTAGFIDILRDLEANHKFEDEDTDGVEF